MTSGDRPRQADNPIGDTGAKNPIQLAEIESVQRLGRSRRREVQTALKCKRKPIRKYFSL